MLVKSEPPLSVDYHDSASPPPYDPSWQQSLARLQATMDTYREVDAQGHETDKHTEEAAQKVANAMREVGENHPDPKVRGEWKRRAEKFAHSSSKLVRRTMLDQHRGPVGASLCVVGAVVGTALHIVGGVIHTVGSIVTGLGDGVSGVGQATSDDFGRRERRRRHREGRD